MKEILIYENRKCPRYIWDISTPELKAAAFLALFKLLDESWHVYQWEPEDMQMELGDQTEYDLYCKAKAGNWKAAYTLLDWRSDYEYEKWETIEVEK